MKKITLTIDGFEIRAKNTSTILEVALENGIYIPNLCYHEDLKPSSVCRLCLVEVDGRMITSCNTKVAQDMKVKTETKEIDKTRRMIVELLLVNHELDCFECNQSTLCKLQKAANYVGVDEERLTRLRQSRHDRPVDRSDPFFDFNPNKCILCGVCVRTCDEIASVHAIDFSQRGYATRISTFDDNRFKDSRCSSCGECLTRCPTGALTIKERKGVSRWAPSICPYCGVGCAVELGVRGNRIISVKGSRESPVNKGQLCVKGRFGLSFVNHEERLKMPLIRKNGRLEEASWDDALDFVAREFKKVTGDQFAVFTSAKCTNEENYIIQKFTRAVMGSNNIDHCARL